MGFLLGKKAWRWINHFFICMEKRVWKMVDGEVDLKLEWNGRHKEIWFKWNQYGLNERLKK